MVKKSQIKFHTIHFHFFTSFQVNIRFEPNYWEQQQWVSVSINSLFVQFGLKASKRPQYFLHRAVLCGKVFLTFWPVCSQPAVGQKQRLFSVDCGFEPLTHCHGAFTAEASALADPGSVWRGAWQLTAAVSCNTAANTANTCWCDRKKPQPPKKNKFLH